MTVASDLLDGLNAEQREAVETVNGPVLIIAGPGSGKTRVLTHRIAYLIREYGVEPWEILAVTFTNKAASELKARLEHLTGEAAGRLTASTFHSFCVRVLRVDGHHLGLGRSFTIYDTDDQLAVIKRALKALDLDPKQHAPRAILSRISNAKCVRTTPADFRAWANQTYFDEIVARVYDEYQRFLTSNDALDFDDLLNRTVDLFERFPAVLARYRQRYRYLLVDEYQDTNLVQYRLIQLLAAGERANLCVVGDEDQSIYRFRGADITNLRNFRHDYPTARTIFLTSNYRSTQPILETAMAVIQSNPERTPKELRSVLGAGQKVTLHECHDERHEADVVANQIARLRQRHGYRYRDFAVMYRTNAQSRVFEQAFDQRRVPLQLIGGIRFHERQEVKDVMALLRATLNPADTLSLRRIIGSEMPLGKGIGPKALEALDSWASQTGADIASGLDALVAMEDGAAPPGGAIPAGRAKGALLDFARTIAQLRRAADSLSLTEFFREALELSGYLKHLSDTQQFERLENVRELANEIGRWPNQEPHSGLLSYLDDKSLVSDADGLDERSDRVTLITLHAAKGLEFRAVFLVGLEEGLLPHSRAVQAEDDRELQEERRLAYVGITRAKEHLYITYAFRRSRFGQEDYAEPSRFLADLPEAWIEQVTQRVSVSGAGAPRDRARPHWHSDSPGWGGAGSRFTAPRRAGPGANVARPAQTGPAPLAGFRTGDTIVHGKFGLGQVIGTKNLSDDQDVTIRFQDGVVRTLSANFARLQRR